jgi:hypothetical protein
MALTLSQARNALMKDTRTAFLRALLTCPANLHWKVWLAGARLELSAGSIAKARRLLCKAFVTVPFKSRSHVFLECARVEEYAGNVNGARKILQRAGEEVRGEWKVFLESVLLEARAGDMRGAVQAAKQALEIHSGTGRLWAILIQICHRVEGSMPHPNNTTTTTVAATNATRGRRAAARRVALRASQPSQLRPSAEARHGTQPATTSASSSADATTTIVRPTFLRAGRRPTSASAGSAGTANSGTGTNVSGSFDVSHCDSSTNYPPIPSKHDVLLRALREVPKSGEVRNSVH